jgi:FG-GAP repeat protein
MRQRALSTIVAVFVALGAGFEAASAQCPFHEQQRVTAPGGTYLDYFGIATAIDGQRALIGSPRDLSNQSPQVGRAIVFQPTNGTWVSVATLLAPDGVIGDRFGLGVALSGDVALVGAPLADGVPVDSGAAYVFTRDGSGNWNFTTKFTASDGTASDRFGSSVAVEGDSAVIGAPFDDATGIGAGSAYVFQRQSGVWSQLAKLTPNDSRADQHFGSAVALHGSNLVIGADTDDERGVRTGAAYVFSRVGSMWTQTQKLTASEGRAGDIFGATVSLSDDLVAVGAPGDDAHFANRAPAYVFEPVGGSWTEVARIPAGDRTFFGDSISAQSGRILIGAYSGVDGGAAYFVEKLSGVWTQTQSIVASDHGQDDEFGSSVALGQEIALVGATEDDNGAHGYIGNAYFFTNAPSILQQPTSQTICESQSVTFSVTADLPSAAFQWTKNGAPVAGATSSSYTIPFVLTRDAGTYAAIVSSGCASVSSSGAVLTVQPLFDVRAGNVNGRLTAPQNVLFVNGSAGRNPDRRILNLTRTSPIQIQINNPPSRHGVNGAHYAMYFWLTDPTKAMRERLPVGVGDIACPTPLTGNSPRPTYIANNTGCFFLGAEHWIPQASPTQPTPYVLLNAPTGIGRAITFYVQGIIDDADSPTRRVAVTNGVLVSIP